MTPRSKPGAFYQQRTACERQIITEAVLIHPTHTAAAKALGLKREYMLRLMSQLGIPRDRAARQARATE